MQKSSKPRKENLVKSAYHALTLSSTGRKGESDRARQLGTLGVAAAWRIKLKTPQTKLCCFRLCPVILPPTAVLFNFRGGNSFRY
ncbi:hypothetical protein QYF36_018783 [Acer negundo]|nr:hypothetical protein QYF36_018783 [Acer negundo]